MSVSILAYTQFVNNKLMTHIVSLCIVLFFYFNLTYLFQFFVVASNAVYG